MKAEGAFLTIGELSAELGVPQHILRYWESRFPQLRPLQRSGNRRYYRTADVELARHIHRLLNVEGFTVRGAQRALEEWTGGASVASSTVQPVPKDAHDEQPPIDTALIARLESIRNRIAAAIG